MNITSPTLLKIKGALFLLLGILSGGLLLLFVAPPLSWQIVLLLGICIWAFCRAYYFCFYVMQHYADPDFKYAGILDLFLHLTRLRKKTR